SLTSNDIYTVFEDRHGDIWIGTKHHGATRYNKRSGKFTRFRHDPADPTSIPDDEIQAILEDEQGGLWLASRDNGLIHFDHDTQRFAHYRHSPEDTGSLPQMSICDLTLSKDGRLILIPSIEAVGLIFFDPRDHTYEHFRSRPGDPFSFSSDTIQGAFEDRSGTLWITDNTGKVDKADPKAHRFNLYVHNPFDSTSLASNAPLPIYEDRQGTVWLGNFGAGLDRYNPETDDFTHFIPDPSDSTTLPHGYPAGFYEDHLGNFIVSTAEGMVIFDRDTGKVTKRLTDDTWLYTIIQDTDDLDVVWAVGWEQSFHRFNMETGEHKIYLHDPEDPTSFAAVTSIRFELDTDDPNLMWIATWGGGLELFDKRADTFTHHQYDPDDSTTIASNTVFDLLEDSRGIFWVCTDRGLDRFDKDTGVFTHISHDQGFTAKIVHNIVEDQSGRLWLGTDVGLVQYDAVEGRVLKVYTKGDGLHSHDFWPTSRRCTQTGHLWFGGFNGVNSFHPDDLRDNETAPRIVLTTLKQDGHEIEGLPAFEALEDLHLDWRHNSFEFEYVALNFTRVSKNRYEYFLDGYDRNWYDAGDIRFGRYSNIPGGNYTLRVRGTNNDGLWSLPEQEVRLSILVDSPPWKTWPAYAAYLLSAFGSIVGFSRWRLGASEAQRLHLQQQVEARTVELVEAKELAEAGAQAKADFLANMSHEIRTPMNAIIGMAHLALRTNLDPKQADYVRKIHGSGQHLLGIINDILDFSKIEAGKMDVEVVSFDLDQVLDNVGSLIGSKAAAKDLELIFDIDLDLPRHLQGDPLRLGQVLINYANNAVKFTEQGQIVVRAHLVPDSANDLSSNDLLVRFEVQDTGIGLSEEQMDRLFQSFQQADTSTTREFGGTGLGLAISKNLTTLMGGEVGVESQLGQGSTFWFTAPLVRGQERRSDLIPEPELRDLSVLIVDDNELTRQVISRLLQSMTFRTRDVASADQALREIERADAESASYEIVFMDWGLPGSQNGTQVAQQISTMNLQIKPRVVLVTDHGHEEVLQQMAGADIEASLIKPINRSSLFDTTMRLLGGKSRAVEAAKQPSGVSVEDLARIRGASILLVEDNPLNQQVAVELLSQAGFDTALAENGRIATQMVDRDSYDLILMDMQMPVMDGCTATRQIRLSETKLPILAMTANAMAQDREQCIAAGMNDHIAKPIDPDLLLAKLVEWIPPLPEERRTTPAVEASTAEADQPSQTGGMQGDPLRQVDGLDVDAGLRNVANNREFYVRLLRGFVSGIEADTVHTVTDRLATDDRDGAERAAHSLKGVAGTLGAQHLQELAQQLETGVREKTDISTQLAAVDRSLTQLLGEINAVLPVEEEAPVATEETVSLKDVAALIEALESHRPTWADISETLSINDVEVFGDQIRELGDQHGATSLTQWGQSLSGHASMFDLDKMVATLRQYPDLIEQLRSEAN
ncbi:MAG: response regulator, partial [Gemmatimonadetes bacterium]|nr:response regulator [Gemmatimonadota bacterium]